MTSPRFAKLANGLIPKLLIRVILESQLLKYIATHVVAFQKWLGDMRRIGAENIVQKVLTIIKD